MPRAVVLSSSDEASGGDDGASNGRRAGGDDDDEKPAGEGEGEGEGEDGDYNDDDDDDDDDDDQKSASDSDSNSSSSSSSDNALPDSSALDFLDVEAQEESSSPDAHDSASSDIRARFPFMRMPPELRARVWELFCPLLVEKARVLRFDLAPASAAAALRSPSLAGAWTVLPSVFLAEHTRSLRCLMAVHDESRQLGLRVFPDTLAMDRGDGQCDAIMRFNKHLDIVSLQSHARPNPLRCHMPGFAENVTSAAICYSPMGGLAETIVNAAIFHLPSGVEEHVHAATLSVLVFRNLQRLYLELCDYDLATKDLAWVASGYVHEFLTETYQERHGIGEDLQTLTVWPDVDNHPDFAKYQLPTFCGIEKLRPWAQTHRLPIWPMVTFEFTRGMERHERIMRLKDVPYHDANLDDSDMRTAESGVSGYGTEQDEYESEGIDDDVIEHDHGPSEEDDDLVVHDSDSSDVTAGQPSDAAPRGRFSSLETDAQGDDASASADREQQPRRQPKRRIVADSDDDDSSAPEQPKAKRARTSRRAVADSDSDDSALVEPKACRAPASRYAMADSDSDSDSSTPKQRQSLAERLQAHRDAHPIPSSERDESSDGEDSADDDDEEESGDDGNGLVDEMASESDGEGDGSGDGSEDIW